MRKRACHLGMLIVVGAGLSVGVGPLRAQWVTFSDETASRLSLTQVDINDNQEKDMTVADFDHDGWTDAIVVRKVPFSNQGPRVDVLLMNEGGALVDRTADLAPGFIDALTDARDVRAVDVNGDGWEDLVIANTFFQMPSVYMNKGVNSNGVWRGFANESFRIPAIPSTGSIKFCAVGAGDVTGNGAPDLYFSNYNGGDDVLLINDGNGFFTDETVARLGGLANVAFGTANEIHDVDNDGDNDIVRISTLGGPGVQIFFNNGAGVFTNAQNVPDNSAYMFTMGDLNDNGMLDIYIVQDPQDRVDLATSMNPDSSVAYNVVTLSQSPRTTGFGGNTHMADIDGDGDLDIGVGPIDVDIANCGPGQDLALLENPGDGVFFDPYPANPDQNFHLPAHDFAFFDINNDGCLDLFEGLCTGWRVFIQNDCQVSMTGDLNGDGVVDGADLASLLTQWGTNGSADLNGDGTVDGADLATLLTNWG